MSADQTAAELTTRDVLLQVDRRLTLIEGDLRTLDDKIDGLDDKLDSRIDSLRSEVSAQINGLRGDVSAQFNGLRGELTGLRGELTGLRGELTDQAKRFESRFTWTVTTIIAMTGVLIAVIKL